jgi:ABC-type antimicrobial peptide transport system permease subunit
MESLAVDLRAALKDIDASLPMGTPRVLVDVMSDSVKKPRFAAVVLSAFAAVALVIAALGLYGVLAFDVSQQRREMGVRIALGATPRTIRALVVNRGFRLVAAGLAVGVIGALGFARVMAGMLFQAPGFDALALGGAVGLLALAAMLAVWLPARRATRADPIDALRAE